MLLTMAHPEASIDGAPACLASLMGGGKFGRPDADWACLRAVLLRAWERQDVEGLAAMLASLVNARGQGSPLHRRQVQVALACAEPVVSLVQAPVRRETTALLRRLDHWCRKELDLAPDRNIRRRLRTIVNTIEDQSTVVYEASMFMLCAASTAQKLWMSGLADVIHQAKRLPDGVRLLADLSRNLRAEVVPEILLNEALQRGNL